MKGFGKKAVVLVTTAAMASAFVTGCGKFDAAEVVATVGDSEITADVANFYARYQQAQYETYYASYLGEDMWEQEETDGKTYEDTVKAGILESLEELYILEDHMKDYEVELSEEEQKAIKKAAETFFEDNGLEEKKAVSGEVETVERYLTLLTIQNKMSEKMVADVDREVSDDEAAQKSMDYVTFSFNTTNEAGESVALTEDEKKELKKSAQEFADGAGEAKDFKAYAEEKGFEASTVTFDAEKTSPNADLIAAADALKEGAVTDLIETDNGYYVGKVTSLLDREATDAKKETIINERESELYQKTVKEWKENTKIKEHKNVWDKISFVKQGVTIKTVDEEPYTD